MTYLVSVVNHNSEEHCGNSSPEHKDLHELTMDEMKIDATPSHDKATKNRQKKRKRNRETKKKRGMNNSAKAKNAAPPNS